MQKARETKGKEGIFQKFVQDCYEDLDGILELRYTGKRFFVWRDGVYSEVDSEDIKIRFTRWVAEQDFPGFKNSRYAADEALHHVRTMVYVESQGNSLLNKFLDKEVGGKFIAFRNGIVCLEDLLKYDPKHVKVLEHTPNFFNLAKIPFDFEPEAKAKTWESILDKVIPCAEDRKIIQQWFGYHLIPTLSYSKMMFLEGSGANGKSVVLLVLRMILGEENVSSLPLSAFDADKPFRLASTEGKLANLCEEMGAAGPHVENTVKQYVNGGAFTVERKFKDPFILYPTAKLTFATNEMPSFADRSTGLWRRMLYIRFPVSIPKEQQRKEFLERNFWLSRGELSGVLNWAIQGAKELLHNDSFFESPRKKQEIEEIYSEADLLRPWVRDLLEEGSPNDFVSTTCILDRLRESISSGHLPRVGPREIFKEIKAQFPNSERPNNAKNIGHGKRARVICGIKLRSDI